MYIHTYIIYIDGFWLKEDDMLYLGCSGGGVEGLELWEERKGLWIGRGMCCEVDLRVFEWLVTLKTDVCGSECFQYWCTSLQAGDMSRFCEFNFAWGRWWVQKKLCKLQSRWLYRSLQRLLEVQVKKKVLLCVVEKVLVLVVELINEGTVSGSLRLCDSSVKISHKVSHSWLMLAVNLSLRLAWEKKLASD